MTNEETNLHQAAITYAYPYIKSVVTSTFHHCPENIHKFKV